MWRDGKNPLAIPDSKIKDGEAFFTPMASDNFQGPLAKRENKKIYLSTFIAMLKYE